MPLSEDEQRRLDEIERALKQQDPQLFATRLATRRLRGRWLVGGAVVLLGALILVVGLVVTAEATTAGVLVGIVGACAMIVGVVLWVRPRR